MIHRDHGHASNRFRICVRQKNPTAFREDCRPRIAERPNVFRLKNEMSADPLFVQGPKCRCILGYPSTKFGRLRIALVLTLAGTLVMLGLLCMDIPQQVKPVAAEQGEL